SEAISFDIPETKSAFETLPVPLGSSVEKMASAPCFWNTAGGFLLWNAWSNCDCVMLPEPEVSIESNRLDIFCCGGPLELAAETACKPPAALTPEISMPTAHAVGRTGRTIGCDKMAGPGKQFVYQEPDLRRETAALWRH